MTVGREKMYEMQGTKRIKAMSRITAGGWGTEISQTSTLNFGQRKEFKDIRFKTKIALLSIIKEKRFLKIGEKYILV